MATVDLDMQANALEGDYLDGYVAGLRDARELCLKEQFQRPENRLKKNPRAAYQSAALRCAWVILQRLKELSPAWRVNPWV
jgi:hypothetical protein